ncbi:MAG: S8 family serine peptidase [Geobacteraceae bacterium]|nr:S8 family serine peptidase [Geobacteraceae bacterium]
MNNTGSFLHGTVAVTTACLMLLCQPLCCRCSFAAPPLPTSKAPAAVLQRLAAGTPQEVIVLFDGSAVETEAALLRGHKGLRHDDAAILAHRAARYQELKRQALAELSPDEFEIKRDYGHLPMAFLRVRSGAALQRLLARADVLAAYENGRLYRQLSQSLPLIREPQAAALGMTGAGTSVAVLDTGVNYTLPAFGSCSAPGVPAGCRVSAAVDIAPADGALDDFGHGTNVAGIAAGTASGAQIVSLDIFNADGTSTEALAIEGIDWAIANRAVYNIVAVNMSFGNGLKYTAACGNRGTNPFVTPVDNVRAAGITPVAASGNEAYTNGISRPACTPGVVSVGAVYDANVGGLSWSGSGCTDYTTAADKVTCFSNSSNNLTILAPGALITATGSTMGGTSQATPHVAGAVAVLRAAFPEETLDQTSARLTGSGVPVTDPRNGVTMPRLNLLASLGAPVNDQFAAATLLAGDSGAAASATANATKEAGEPFHAGNAGGASVWWRWTPPFSGRAVIDTHGSGFDTLLAVYTGADVAALTQVAANDNDGSANGTGAVTFIALAGTEYRIAVDGFGGASGPVTLNWSLAPEADLALSVDASPDPLQSGEELSYLLTVSNAGPSTAAGVSLSDTLPANAALVSASPGCTEAGGTVTCAPGDIPAGQAASVTIVVRPQGASPLTNTASVTSSTPDPAPGNNSAAAETAVTEPPPPAVPALPLWGMVLAAGLLAACTRRQGKSLSRG